MIENPVTGQRLVFEATAKETGGEMLRLPRALRARARLARSHGAVPLAIAQDPQGAAFALYDGEFDS